MALALSTSTAALAAGPGGLSGLFSEQPIVEAARKGSLSDAQAALIDGASANARADDGTPVLVIAVKSENEDLVRLLMENGARPDEKAKDETTALTLASANGNLEIASYLLDHGADVNEPGSLRETAIIKAVRARRNPVVRLLVAKGANLDETDAAGATALDIAESAGWQDTAALLKKVGPK
jgi:ankyrin repeat protein